MKKSIIIILSAMCFSSLQAQKEKRDFQYFDAKIDSFTAVYSTKTYKEISYFSFSNLNVIVILNEKERKKIVEKIKNLFEQDDYVNLYTLGHRLLDGMWNIHPSVQNSTQINQMLMELYLQYYFYPYAHENVCNIDYYDLNIRKNYTPKARKRIIEILEEKKTKKEFEIILKYEKSRPSSYELRSWEDAARIMKKQETQNAEVLKQIRDSLLIDKVNRYANSSFNSLQISPHLIKMIGFLDMKECIPALKKNLENCIVNRDTCDFGTCWCSRDDIKAYRYALARLGDREQRQYILDNLMDVGFGSNRFDRRDFAYFRDDEMVWRYIEVNYFSNKIIRNGSESSDPASYVTIDNVYPLIKNLPEELVSPYFPDMNGYYQWAKLLYEWLMENKNTVEFDYEVELMP